MSIAELEHLQSKYGCKNDIGSDDDGGIPLDYGRQLSSSRTISGHSLEYERQLSTSRPIGSDDNVRYSARLAALIPAAEEVERTLSSRLLAELAASVVVLPSSSDEGGDSARVTPSDGNGNVSLDEGRQVTAGQPTRCGDGRGGGTVRVTPAALRAALMGLPALGAAAAASAAASLGDDLACGFFLPMLDAAASGQGVVIVHAHDDTAPQSEGGYTSSKQSQLAGTAVGTAVAGAAGGEATEVLSWSMQKRVGGASGTDESAAAAAVAAGLERAVG